MQPGDTVVFVTPDQMDEDALAEVMRVREGDQLDLRITFADGSVATSFFVLQGTRPGQWHPVA